MNGSSLSLQLLTLRQSVLTHATFLGGRLKRLVTGHMYIILDNELYLSSRRGSAMVYGQ